MRKNTVPRDVYSMVYNAKVMSPLVSRISFPNKEDWILLKIFCSCSYLSLIMMQPGT